MNISCSMDHKEPQTFRSVFFPSSRVLKFTLKMLRNTKIILNVYKFHSITVFTSDAS